MKNLLKPTPGQIKYRNRKWAEALKKNKKKAKGQMRIDGGRCCLAVAENVAISMGLDLGGLLLGAGMPRDGVEDFFGWGRNEPWLVFGKTKKLASDLNDSYDLSHKKIAECVVNTFCRKSS